jgi:endo-1,4-beta-xylanase
MNFIRIKKTKIGLTVVLAIIFVVLIPMSIDAQLAKGYTKFLGSIHYKGKTPLNFGTYWNQVTPENEGKWPSCEQAKDDFNYWLWLDRAYEYAQTNGLKFKEHCLVWGHSSGEPSWVCSLTTAEQKTQVEQWMAALAERYPNFDYIDVVNEPLHDVPCYKDAIGGDGATGWDWVIWSYETARRNFPNAKLLINEYGTLESSSATSRYLGIINLLADRGLVDGIGVEGHSLESVSASVIKSNLDALADTGLPIYLSEYDVNVADDAQQQQVYQAQFPIFWEHPAVAGVTLWGYVQGEIWRTDAYLIRTDGSERPAMQWLKSYLSGGNATEAPTPTPTPIPSALFVESSGQVVMEAENYTDYFPGTGSFASYSWVSDSSIADASGGSHMVASPNSGGQAPADEESPKMGYFVNFSTSGIYYVWVRRAAQGGNDDSCQIAMDSGSIIEWSYGGGSTFDWVKASATFSVSKGAHIFKVGMREDGARVDKIVLTTSSSFTPSGQGPAQSPISGTPPDNPTPGSTAGPTPATTVGPSAVPGCSCTLGDANCSGSIDIVDALLVAQFYVGLSPANYNSCAADVNNSGTADIVDALRIAQYYVGLITSF